MRWIQYGAVDSCRATEDRALGHHSFTELPGVGAHGRTGQTHIKPLAHVK